MLKNKLVRIIEDIEDYFTIKKLKREPRGKRIPLETVIKDLKRKNRI